MTGDEQAMFDDQRAQIAQLEQALVSSRVISTAVGIVMIAHSLDEQPAFRLLVTASQRTNRRLNLVARDVVRDRGLTDTGPTPAG